MTRGNGHKKANGNGTRRANGGATESREAAKRRFFLAGATGFLGAHLYRLLTKRGHDVIAVSRSGGEVDGLPVSALDVSDAEAVAKAAEGCDGAFIATGKVSRDPADAEELHRANVVTTRELLKGLREAKVPRVVYASTSGTIAIGENPDRIFDEETAPPLELVTRWPYYRSKLYAEREALEKNSADFKVVIVNPSLLLGPGDRRESSTGDVRRFLERAIPATPAGGMAFVDARDAALGMLLAFERGRPGERYLLNAKNLTIAAFFQRLERMTGVRAPLVKLPASRPLALGITDLFSRAVRAIGGEPPVDAVSVEMAQYYWYCDSTKAERDLGWEARDPGETLRDTIDDIRASGSAATRQLPMTVTPS